MSAYVPIPIDRKDVRRLMESGAQIVEALPRDEYEGMHLLGAINIPLKELDARSAALLRLDVPVVAYCADLQ